MSDEYIIEYKIIGDIIKVSAICPKTYVEVNMQAHKSSSRQHLNSIIIKKLQYVLNKRAKK